jgi:O-antigen ligase
MTVRAIFAPSRPAPTGRSAGLIAMAVAVGLAAMLGLCAGAFGAGIGLALLAALLLLPVILYDYRAGVVLLTLLLPVAPMLPQLKGLNALNFATIATLASLFLRDAFGTRRRVALPRALWIGLVLPASWGIAVAWPHIPEASHNYPALTDPGIYEPWAYVAARYAKPLFYYLSYALLLANAVRDSERPQRFASLLGAAIALPAITVFYTVATYPGTLLDVSRNREFMAARGLHANEFGMMLAVACGPLLFMGTAVSSAAWRWTMRFAFALATAALLLTFSRGGLMAWLVIVLGYLLHHRRLKTFLIAAALTAALLFAAPESMKQRFGAGLHPGAMGDVSDVEKDELTAGRVHGWILLAPEVLESPWFGRGLGSTQWSEAVATGRYKANHPHSIYLEILMDLGLIGFAAMAWLHAGHLRRFGRLSRDACVPAELRACFAGARWSLMGLLAMAATTAYYMPNAAQFPLWFCLGLAFAWNEPAGAARGR